MSLLFEICYTRRYHGKVFTRSGVYNLNREQAETALRRAQAISNRYYFIRQHTPRQKLNLLETYINED